MLKVVFNYVIRTKNKSALVTNRRGSFWNLFELWLYALLHILLFSAHIVFANSLLVERGLKSINLKP